MLTAQVFRFSYVHTASADFGSVEARIRVEHAHFPSTVAMDIIGITF